MEDIFNQILSTKSKPSSSSSSSSSSSLSFISSKKFDGKKDGYKFQLGDKGLGYYHDLVQIFDNKKRKFDDDIDDNNDNNDNEPDHKRITSSLLNKELTPQTIDQLLEEAEKSGIKQLDAVSLKQLLLSFEKKINKNQMLRSKYSNDPQKFMESEIDLNNEIQELYAIAASPELYPTLLESGSLTSILGMITHENTDISLASIGLIQEMTDPNTLLEVEEAIALVDSFLDLQGLELIVQNLSRLDESNEDDYQGIHNTLNIIENLQEVRSNVAVMICERTNILEYLLVKLKAKKYDSIKLYCSEILSILLQADALICNKLCNMNDTNGVESLLEAISYYRKRDPNGMEEQECIENIFLCLSSVLISSSEGQSQFMELEGFELMVRCLKEQKYAALCSVRSISYAIINNKIACEKIVNIGGLKYLFPILMGRGLPKMKKKSTGSLIYDVEQSILSIISQLCIHLHDSNENDSSVRILAKFIENGREKLERCTELYLKYRKQLENTEHELSITRELLMRQGDDDELELFDDTFYKRRLEGGLSCLHYLAITLTFACVCDNDCLKLATSKLNVENSGLDEVLEVLQDAADNIGDDDNDNNKKTEEKETLNSWVFSLKKVMGLVDDNNDKNNDDHVAVNNDNGTINNHENDNYYNNNNNDHSDD